VPKPPEQTVFQVRIELEDVQPAVWRRLLVPGGVRLAKVHLMFQAAMGWTNSHLHAFTIGDERFGMCFDDFPEGEIDETEVTMIGAVRDHGRFAYEYDFGDGWDHVISIEDRFSLRHGLKYAVCLAGENGCPPEDCGGAPGYDYLREALADPAHEDHSNLLEWLGGPFDSTQFDLVAVNVALQRVR
jgi:hypothetical protein